jgi:hypothetical protein
VSEMIERCAKALVMCEHFADPDAPVMVGMKTVKAWESRIPRIRAILEAMREPTEAMVRATVTQVETSADDMDFGAAVIEGMPPLRPEKQREGIEAAAELRRDWQAMIDAALK